MRAHSVLPHQGMSTGSYTLADKPLTFQPLIEHLLGSSALYAKIRVVCGRAAILVPPPRLEILRQIGWPVGATVIALSYATSTPIEIRGVHGERTHNSRLKANGWIFSGCSRFWYALQPVMTTILKGSDYSR